MAPPKVKNPKKSAKAYQANPGSYAKKLANDKKFNKKPEQRKKRSQLSTTREKLRKNGVALSGKDLSHTRSGGLVLENSSTNRARNGHGKNGRLK